MKWHVADANQPVNNQWTGITASVVGQWLEWEIEREPRATLEPDAAKADAVMLVFSGSIDWLPSCRRTLRARGIEPLRHRRGSNGPLVVTGGPVDSTPGTAMKLADGLVVGEGYRLARLMLRAGTVADVHTILQDDDHAIGAAQWDRIAEPDPLRLWLRRHTGAIAAPDPYVDWDVPDVKSDDQVVRVVSSKGCHLKCAFCATTYRQAYSARPPDSIRARVEAHSAAGERVQVLSNDPLNLDGFRQAQGRIDHASLTLMELADPENRRAVIRKRPRIVRVGVEGLSERIRRAVGKPMTNDQLIGCLADLHRNRIASHNFWIHGLPFESYDDWAEMTAMYDSFTATIDWGVHRAKMTQFLPAPPAPLARYLPLQPQPSRGEIITMRTMRRHWNRILVVAGGRSGAWRDRVAEQYGVHRDALPWDREETVDMAPTFEDWCRMPAEAIAWPIDAARRYKISETYPRRLMRPARKAA